ncbi:sensor histidine kinase RcsC [Rhodoferax lithotrophicus]|uniref:histidine kinase n=1 Tax=Rhodoferax lithotrophicus TaxID=2798804 RepID=A0ABN6D226_9BURK|nr:response regulator [Rhodoferax sp. MIZ03]BCO26066.1 sensor histidine kinase RcsC [Rhodoferax sp. MIZ03]
MTIQPKTPLIQRKKFEWMLLLMALALIGLLIVDVLVREFERIRSSESERLNVLTHVIASDIQENLAAANRALAGVIKDYPGTPGDSHSVAEVSRRLAALSDTMLGIRGALVLNAQGITTAAHRPEFIGQDFSQRDYFKTVRDRPNPTTLYLSAPFQSVQNDLVVTLARMVPGLNGEFAGLVLATLDPKYFTSIFKSLVYAPDVWAFIDHGSGLKLMNFPEKPGINGTNVAQAGSLFSRHLQSGQVSSLLSGEVLATGEQRLFAMRSMQPAELFMDEALVIGVSRLLSAMNAPVQRQALTYGLFYLVLVLLCCSSLYGLQRWRRQKEAFNIDREHDRYEANERLKAAQRQASLGNWAWDIQRDSHFWSEEVSRIYGRDPTLPPAAYPEVRQYFTPASWALLAAAVEAAQTTGTSYEVDAEVVRPDGSHRWITARGEPLRNSAGSIISLQGTVQDITEKKLLDMELAQHRHHLEELVQSRTLALAGARDAAETANRGKAEFLANMSHEIRSPLNAILGLAYLLEQAHLAHDELDMVRKIRTSGRSLLGIINDILDVSKIEAGHLVIEQAPFRLDDVIDNLADAMGLAAGNKNIELVIGPLPTGLSMVKGDALRLGQVLNNLTSNAIKFTAVGRVVLHCALLSRDDERIMLRFSVQDTGIGIAPELQQQVFTAFTQADSSTTRRFGGTGLGLTICRQLVQLMGGEIGLTSTLGQGSEFWFTLPLQQIANTEFSSPDMVRVEALIADDSDVALHALSAIAEGLGWQVKAVDSGAEVLAQVLQHKGDKLPHVVVLDWKMPGLDGLATARAIREGVAQEECPIVIMATAYSVASLASQPGADLVDAILNKPVTASTLYNAVLEAQHRRSAHADLPQALLQTPNNELMGVRVLIVDDSDINREVALRILREQGAIVTLAEDGKAALDWLLAHPLDVDLVLMDVQMPVMDGIEATRQLRQLPQFNNLPIVALTAGAFKSQQDAARAAGMSDFISKPFDVPATIALIARLRRPSPTAHAGDHPVQASTPAGVPGQMDSLSVDLAVMDVAQGLLIWKDLPSYRDYLRRFVSAYGQAVDVINASLIMEDMAGAAALAHKLSGVAANLALPDTHRLAGEAERVLAKGYDPTLVLARLGMALTRVVSEIAQFAPLAVPNTVADTPEGSPQVLQARLTDLLAALDTDNPAPAMRLLAILAKQLPAQALSSISDKVQGYDFRGAEADTFELARVHGLSLKE